MDHENHINHGEGMDMTTGHGVHDMDMDMDMAMYFHFGRIIWSSIVIFLICFAYEGTKWARTYLRRRELSSQTPFPEGTPRQRKLTPNMIIDGSLHGVQLLIGYSLMLVFMTFNVWLCLATVFGEVVAHLFFRFLYPDLDRFNLGTPDETCCG